LCANGGCPDPVSGALPPAVNSAIIQPAASTGPLYPLTAIPALNSDFGAPATLYLDFHGEPAGSWLQTVPATPAYDIDGDPTTFSAQELTNIQQIWAAIAEAYSPFNVNVTTVDPGNWSTGGHRQFRDIIGGNGSWTGVAEGGTAYVGSYSDGILPDTAYVFSTNLGNDPTYTAIDAVHEAGHGFGLQHQSFYSGATKTSEYNPGNGVTAPFMGNALNGTRATWWDGQSSLGYNVIQDDVSVLTRSLGLRPENVGQGSSAASPLSVSGTSLSGSGIVESLAQQDYFSFTTAGGTCTFSVNVAQYRPMLHAILELHDASNNVIAVANNAGALSQTITANLAAGQYYLVVKSYGQYGDLGQYALSGNVPSGGPAYVVGRYIFYNDSLFDGNDPAANSADDGAIASDKQALLPGRVASFANYTSYSKGINGIMLDVANLPAADSSNGTSPGLLDFTFTVGNAADPATWSAAPEPTILVRGGAGVGGSTRIEFVWANGSIRNQWLQVTTKADASTGLSSPDVFYFRSLVGQSGEAAVNGLFTVGPGDEAAARLHPQSFLDSAAVDNPYDYDRDGKVNAADQLIARYSLRSTGLGLFQLDPSAAPTQVTATAVSSQGQMGLLSRSPAYSPPPPPQPSHALPHRRHVRQILT